LQRRALRGGQRASALELGTDFRGQSGVRAADLPHAQRRRGARHGRHFPSLEEEQVGRNGMIVDRVEHAAYRRRAGTRGVVGDGVVGGILGNHRNSPRSGSQFLVAGANPYGSSRPGDLFCSHVM